MNKEKLLSIYRVDVESGKMFRLASSGGEKAGAEAGWVSSHGYVYITVERKKYRRARLIYLAHTGHWPTHQIDHIDRNRTNDSIHNLRDVASTENNFNRGTRVDNTSGHTGVSWARRESRWVAKVGTRTIGYFRTIEEAIGARRNQL